MKALAAWLAGLLFGLGLAISGMMNPAKVLGFLDLAGQWDPTLAFVMGGGLLVNVPAFWATRKHAKPLLERQFYLPTGQDLDARLLSGAALFGIGWGIAGYCPGPALASLGHGGLGVLAFVGAMVVGMALANRLPPAKPRAL